MASQGGGGDLPTYPGATSWVQLASLVRALVTSVMTERKGGGCFVHQTWWSFAQHIGLPSTGEKGTSWVPSLCLVFFLLG